MNSTFQVSGLLPSLKFWRVLALAVCLACVSAGAIAASESPEVVQLWPEGSAVLQQGIDQLTGQPNAVTHPSMLVYTPRDNTTRTAVLVFPGGGYQALAIGPNSTIGRAGADVCGWLTDHGITCVLVRYRVPDTGCNWNPETRRHESPAIPMALQDAQRALSLLRTHAARYGIAPDRIGVMGFSAGGNLAVLSSTHFRTRTYAPVDNADLGSLRPDFAIPVYPGHMTMEHKNQRPTATAAQQLNTDIVISPDIPPTLLIHAKDDAVDPIHYSRVYLRELKKAGVDAELIEYPTGGHAFGVRKQGKDTDRWTEDAVVWLARIGMR